MENNALQHSFILLFIIYPRSNPLSFAVFFSGFGGGLGGGL